MRNDGHGEPSNSAEQYAEPSQSSTNDTGNGFERGKGRTDGNGNGNCNGNGRGKGQANGAGNGIWDAAGSDSRIGDGDGSANGNVGGNDGRNDSGTGNGTETTAPGIDFTAGVIAGAAGLVVGQPFDVVKVRYQTPRFAGKYTSTFGALGAIVREEKVRGLFKGVMSPMAGIAFVSFFVQKCAYRNKLTVPNVQINGVVFTSYSFFMRLQLSPNSIEEPTLPQIFLAGAGSGLVSSLLTCPIELIKIRQQSAPPNLNPTILNVIKSIIRTDGMRGLFRGFSATAMRDLAYGPYFCTYEATCRFFKWTKPPPSPANVRRHEGHTLIDEAEAELARLTWPELMAAGGIAGVTAWLATFPLDVFKTRMQSHISPSTASAPEATTASSPLTKLKPPTLRAVAVDAVRKEGWKVMFAGLGPTLIRAVPVSILSVLECENEADIKQPFADKHGHLPHI